MSKLSSHIYDVMLSVGFQLQDGSLDFGSREMFDGFLFWPSGNTLRTQRRLTKASMD